MIHIKTWVKITKRYIFQICDTRILFLSLTKLVIPSSAKHVGFDYSVGSAWQCRVPGEERRGEEAPLLRLAIMLGEITFRVLVRVVRPGLECGIQGDDQGSDSPYCLAIQGRKWETSAAPMRVFCWHSSPQLCTPIREKPKSSPVALLTRGPPLSP